VSQSVDQRKQVSVNLEAIGHKAMNIEKQHLMQIIDLLEERKHSNDD